MVDKLCKINQKATQEKASKAHINLHIYRVRSGFCLFYSSIYEPRYDKTKKKKKKNGMCAQPRLRSAWASTQSDQSLLCTQWVAKSPSFLYANSKDPNHTGQKTRLTCLIWTFIAHTDVTRSLFCVKAHNNSQVVCLLLCISILLCAVSLTLVMLNTLMPCPFLIFSQSDYLIQVVDTNSHSKWQTVQIQISWLLQKPTDLDLHCLQRQGISGISRTRVKYRHNWSSQFTSKFEELVKEVI